MAVSSSSVLPVQGFDDPAKAGPIDTVPPIAPSQPLSVPPINSELSNILPSSPQQPKKTKKLLLVILLTVFALLLIGLFLYFFVFNKTKLLFNKKANNPNVFLKVTEVWQKECKYGTCIKELTLNSDGSYEKVSYNNQKETGNIDKKLVENLQNASVDEYKSFQNLGKDFPTKNGELTNNNIEPMNAELDSSTESADLKNEDGFENMKNEDFENLIGIAYAYMPKSASECPPESPSFSTVALVLPGGTSWEYGSCLDPFKSWSITKPFQTSFEAVAGAIIDNSLAKITFLETKDLPFGFQADPRPVNLAGKDKKGVTTMNYYCVPKGEKFKIKQNPDFFITQQALITAGEPSIYDKNAGDVLVGDWKGYYSEVLTIDGDTVGHAKVVFETKDLRVHLESGEYFRRSIVKDISKSKSIDRNVGCETITKDVLLRVANSMVPRTTALPSYTLTPHEFEMQEFLKGAFGKQVITPSAVPADWKKETMDLLHGLKVSIPRPSIFQNAESFYGGYKFNGGTVGKLYEYNVDMDAAGYLIPEERLFAVYENRENNAKVVNIAYFPVQVGSRQGWRMEIESLSTLLNEQGRGADIRINTVLNIGKEMFAFNLAYKKGDWTDAQIAEMRRNYETMIGGFDVVKERDVTN